MIQSASSRVLKAIKPVVQAHEDVKRTDFGTVESFLVKVREKKNCESSTLFKAFLSSIGHGVCQSFLVM